jgi:hypothetical protein
MIADHWQAKGELGWHEIWGELNNGSLILYAWVMQSLRLLCETLMPGFHGRLILAPVGPVKPETREHTAREEGGCHADC